MSRRRLFIISFIFHYDLLFIFMTGLTKYEIILPKSFFIPMTGCYEICKFGNNIFGVWQDARNFTDNVNLYFRAHSFFTTEKFPIWLPSLQCSIQEENEKQSWISWTEWILFIPQLLGFNPSKFWYSGVTLEDLKKGL